jgi:hypothetical protein
MHETPGAAHVAAGRHEQTAQPLASRAKPVEQAMLQVTPGQATECEPAGQVLHVHVAQPFESTATPFVHMRLRQLTAGHIPHVGPCQAHLPLTSRVQVAAMIGPEHIGWA